jgi:hypothetical protein
LHPQITQTPMFIHPSLQDTQCVHMPYLTEKRMSAQVDNRLWSAGRAGAYVPISVTIAVVAALTSGSMPSSLRARPVCTRSAPTQRTHRHKEDARFKSRCVSWPPYSVDTPASKCTQKRGSGGCARIQGGGEGHRGLGSTVGPAPRPRAPATTPLHRAFV